MLAPHGGKSAPARKPDPRSKGPLAGRVSVTRNASGVRTATPEASAPMAVRRSVVSAPDQVEVLELPFRRAG